MDINTKKEMKNKLHDFFQKKVRKILPEYESKRKKAAIMQSIFILPFIFSILLILGKYLPQPFGEKLMTLSLLGVFVSIILLPIASSILGYKSNSKGKAGTIDHTLENELKQQYMKELIEIFLEDVKCGKNIEAIDEKNKTEHDYSRNVINLGTLQKFQKRLKELNIFNTIPFLNINDCIAGTYKNSKIKIYEASTKPTTFMGTIFLLFTTIVLFMLLLPFFIILFPLTIWLIYKFLKGMLHYAPFRGLIIEFDFEKNFIHETFFLERSSAAKKIKLNKKLYKRVKLESIYFEKQYQLYSNNQVESRYIFTPAFIEKINKIRDIYRTNKIRGSFKNNKFVLTINTNRDMFALGNDFKETNYKTFLTFYEEMISLLQLADELKRYLK